VREDLIDYRITVNDPATFVTPWTIRFPWHRDPRHTLFEFACHEGNYAMANILSGESPASGER